MIAYKVFEKLKNGSLMSGGPLPRAMQFCYSRKNVNVPKIKGSKFFVFCQLDHAQKFKDTEFNINKHRNRRGKMEIWEISVPELIKIPFGSIFPNVWVCMMMNLK